jgi:hypothetical protein
MLHKQKLSLIKPRFLAEDAKWKRAPSFFSPSLLPQPISILTKLIIFLAFFTLLPHIRADFSAPDVSSTADYRQTRALS